MTGLWLTRPVVCAFGRKRVAKSHLLWLPDATTTSHARPSRLSTVRSLPRSYLHMFYQPAQYNIIKWTQKKHYTAQSYSSPEFRRHHNTFPLTLPAMEAMPIRAYKPHLPPQPRRFQIPYTLPYNHLDRHIKFVTLPMSIIASILSLSTLPFKSSKKPAGPSPRSGPRGPNALADQNGIQDS
jgi:hypothetical protein